MWHLFTNRTIWASDKFYLISLGDQNKECQNKCNKQIHAAAGGSRYTKEDFNSAETQWQPLLH